MTPERLAEIEAPYQVQSDGHAQVVNMLIEEIRHLWAERDARLLVGQPVSDVVMEKLRDEANDTFTPSSFSRACLRVALSHIAFLERLLADADDLPQVRRTGYADGWRAGVEAAAREAETRGTESWSSTVGVRIATWLRKLEPE